MSDQDLKSPVSITPASAVNGAGTVTSPQLLLTDGSVSVPPIGFTSHPTTGLYFSAANLLAVTSNGGFQMDLGGGAIAVRSDSLIGWYNGTVANGTLDTYLSRPAAGVGKLTGTAAATAELQVSGGNGGFISSVKALTELTTIAAAPTTSTAILIPANAVVLGVSVRVVTIIPTAATFTVTSATPTKTWNTAAVAVAAGSTDPGTLPGPTFQTTASAIVITPNLTPGAATGQVRVTIYYYTITPPTS